LTRGAGYIEVLLFVVLLIGLGAEAQQPCVVYADEFSPLSLQMIIDTVPEGTVICLGPDERFEYEAITITKSLTIRGLGADKTTICGMYSPLITIENQGDRTIHVAIEDVGLAGEGGCGWSWRLLLVSGNAEVSIKGCSFWGVDFGMRLEGDARVTVSDSKLDAVGSSIWLLDNATATAEDCVFSGDVFGEDASQLSFRDCSFPWGDVALAGNAEAELSACGAADAPFPIGLRDGARATLNSCILTSVDLEGNAQMTLIGCVIKAGLGLRGSSRVEARKCTISSQKTDCVLLWDSAGAMIEESAITAKENDGVILFGDSQLTLSGCTILHCKSGIVLEGESQATIQNTQITDNQEYGIVAFEEPCFEGYLIESSGFAGSISGFGNEISGNGVADVCPDVLRFLTTSEGGCYGPLCE